MKCQASHIVLYKKRNPNAGRSSLFDFYFSFCQNLPLRFPASILNRMWNYVSNQITRSQMGILWEPGRNNGSENFKLYNISIPEVLKITKGVIILLWKGYIILCFITSRNKISPGSPLGQVATDFLVVNLLTLVNSPAPTWQPCLSNVYLVSLGYVRSTIVPGGSLGLLLSLASFFSFLRRATQTHGL